ncbi:hypothetical protein LT493_29665 [Streptomyces tricolor]|nr:hypothetical protein [Streptomyces tricolor]
MATVLDVHRGKLNEALQETASHGIVFKVRRGVYQFNPPYSYRVAEFIPGTELVEAEYVQVDQDETIAKIRRTSLPDLRGPVVGAHRQGDEGNRKRSGRGTRCTPTCPVRSARRRDQPSEYL